MTNHQIIRDVIVAILLWKFLEFSSAFVTGLFWEFVKRKLR